MEMVMTKAQEIGISNAEAAFDQVHDYSSLQEAINSHYENVQDTLMDEGILTDETLVEAQRAFDARIAQLLSK